MFTDPTFWLLVSFVTFFALLGKKIWALSTASLDARAQKIQAEIDDAIRIRQEALAYLEEIKEKHSHASEHAEQILEHARLESERLKSEAGKELEQFLKHRESLVQDRIAAAEAAAVKEIRNRAIHIGVEAAERLLKQTLDDSVDQKLIECSIEELEGKKLSA